MNRFASTLAAPRCRSAARAAAARRLAAFPNRTAVIKMKKFVAIQDIGLVISPQQAESQINGALIMGIAYSLFEQRINDPNTGAFVNADLANYKLARIGDIGELVVEFHDPESER